MRFTYALYLWTYFLKPVPASLSLYPHEFCLIWSCSEGFGQCASACFDLYWALEFVSAWRQSILLAVWSDWTTVEWHNCILVPSWSWMALWPCQNGALERHLTGTISLQSSSTSQISCWLQKIRIITAAHSALPHIVTSHDWIHQMVLMFS